MTLSQFSIWTDSRIIMTLNQEVRESKYHQQKRVLFRHKLLKAFNKLLSQTRRSQARSSPRIIFQGQPISATRRRALVGTKATRIQSCSWSPGCRIIATEIWRGVPTRGTATSTEETRRKLRSYRATKARIILQSQYHSKLRPNRKSTKMAREKNQSNTNPSQLPTKRKPR